MRSNIAIVLLFASFVFGFSQSKTDKVLIEDVISKHFNWYFTNLDSNSHKNYVRITTNETSGKTLLDVRDYLKYLKALGTVSREFIEGEGRRTSGCNYFLEDLGKQGNFEMDIHNQCDFVYFYFWLYSNKAVNGLVNSSIEIKGKSAVAETMLLVDGNQFKALTIKLVKKAGCWKITAITKM